MTMTNAERIQMMQELKTDIENCKDENWCVCPHLNSFKLVHLGIKTTIGVWRKAWILDDYDKRKITFDVLGDFVEADGETDGKTISENDIKDATAFIKQWLEKT